MTDETIFEWVSSELEKRTGLSRLEARGTLRLVLKDAGLDPSSVRAHQMIVVVDRLMVNALKKRGVEAADDVCHALAEDLRAHAEQAAATSADTPYDVFERLDSKRSGRREK